MTKNEMAEKLGSKRGWLPGKRVKIDFGADGVVLLDGVAERVSEEDGDADTVISLSWADLEALGRGELDPMSAMMQGRLRIAGDMSNAMQLQGVISKLRS
ncbi:MAG TPA: SCP2 sterol-binding domain-containing protein [Allosphingosinicella sp.]|nr:SCP2 sterol-binding domain-containing protein [Allosphingosinicella sp.]